MNDDSYNKHEENNEIQTNIQETPTFRTKLKDKGVGLKLKVSKMTPLPSIEEAFKLHSDSGFHPARIIKKVKF